ncbi:MAG: NAD-binding protein [Actinomycetota bacterium]
MPNTAPAIPQVSVIGLVARFLRGPSLAALAVILTALAGYIVIGGWDWIDGLYMAFVTIGQVGFNEVRPLGTAGRIWTMCVILAGFAVFVYASASLTALFLSGEVRSAIRETRRSKVRSQLSQHVVVAGFGRVGRSAATATIRSGHACVVIDADGAAEDVVTGLGGVFLCGDARDATGLRKAGVSRAAALITSLDDPSNAVVALTARSLSPDLRIVSRVTDQSWRERLMRAGASHAVPVYESVGASLAATALDAEVLGVLPIPGTDMRVEEMEVGVDSRAEGCGLRALMAHTDDVHILGLKRDEGLVRWHEASEGLHAGDVLVVLGTAEALERLTALVRHGSGST